MSRLVVHVVALLIGLWLASSGASASASGELTFEEVMKRWRRSAEQVWAYDVYVTTTMRWPLKTVQVATRVVEGRELPVHEWRERDEGEEPHVDVRYERQVGRADNRARYEMLDPDDGALQTFSVMNEGVERIFDPARRSGTILKVRGGDIAGLKYAALFPSGHGVWPLYRTFSELHSPKLVADPNEPDLIRLECSTLDTMPRHADWRVWLDPQQGWLPVRVEWDRLREGKWHRFNRWDVLESHQLGEGIWVPTKVAFVAYTDSDTELYGRVVNDWEIVVDVAKSHWNEPLDDELFELEYPDGTRLFDRIKDRNETVGPPDDTHDGALTTRGDRCPAFQVKTVDGTEFDTEDLGGRLTLIEFFADWCNPCIHLCLPRVQDDIFTRFSTEKLQVLAIAWTNTEDEVKAFRKDHGFTIPMAADPDGRVFTKFAETSVPRHYLIGSDGRILWQSLGASHMTNLIETIEAELDQLERSK